MLSWLIETLAPVLEAGLYIAIALAVISRIGGAARDKIIPPKRGGGGGGTGVVGHLAVAAIVGSFRIAGQITRAILVGLWTHGAPALARGLAGFSSVIARTALRRPTPAQRPRRRPRMPFEWPPAKPSQRQLPPYPGDDWRRFFGDD